MLEIDGRPLSLESIGQVARGEVPVRLSPGARVRMAASRRAVEEIVRSGRIVYGVNTGLGKLSDVHIPADDLNELQLNLVRSHACGVGEPLPVEEARAMTLLRANVLAVGFSGTRPELADLLAAMLNADIAPWVPSRGSVGASGDLAPLAHLALACVGEGDVIARGVRAPAADALAEAGLSPVELQAKEGLALLNGTQAMAAVGGLALERALRLVDLATATGAMSLEGLLGTPVAFDARIHEARPHPGQVAVAEMLRGLLENSEVRESHRVGCPRVQDAYSLRCMPQVHGAVLDALAHAAAIVETETASATDNPLVFPAEGEVLSGGNFHGAPLAMAFDYAAIALTELGNISERRIDRLVNPDLNEGLPPFLTRNPGTGSGFMIPHVVAVALLNEAKVLSHPASVDNVPTSGGKEDHVSMGMTSALKLRDTVGLIERVIAIELLCAAEALEFRRPLRSGVGVEALHESVRAITPRLDADRSLTADIEALAAAAREGALTV